MKKKKYGCKGTLSKGARRLLIAFTLLFMTYSMIMYLIDEDTYSWEGGVVLSLIVLIFTVYLLLTCGIERKYKDNW